MFPRAIDAVRAVREVAKRASSDFHHDWLHAVLTGHGTFSSHCSKIIAVTPNLLLAQHTWDREPKRPVRLTELCMRERH